MPLSGYITIDGSPIVAQPDPAQFPDIAGKANCYLCPRGKDYGRGWLLMRRGDVTALSLEVSHTITFVQQDVQSGSPVQLKLQGAWITKATRLPQQGGLSGPVGDANAPYLVEFVDRRYLLCKFSNFNITTPGRSFGRSYNVRHRLPQTASLDGSSAAEYMAPSLLGGTTIATWDTMLQDIWRSLGGWNGMQVTFTDFVGHDWPGLPYTPGGRPEGWHFWGANPWFAIHEVLKKLECDTSYNPATDTFSVVRLGTQQSDWQAAQSLPYRYDADILMSTAARVPKQINAGFHVRQPEPCIINDRFLPAGNTDGDSDATVTNMNTSSGSIAPSTLIKGSAVLLWDDLLYEPGLESPAGGGTTANAPAKARLNERAGNYQNRVLISDFENRRCFNGLMITVMPGSEIDMVAWRHHDVEVGFVTWASSGHGNTLPWRCDCDDQALAAINERISPPDFGRHGWDALWPRTTSLVQVTDNTFTVSAVPGVCVGATYRVNPSSGFDFGNPVHNTLVGEALAEAVWVVPVNRLGNVLGSDYKLTNGGVYVGQLMGTWQAQTSPFDTHALYAVQAADGDILGSKFFPLTGTSAGAIDVVTSVNFGASTTGTRTLSFVGIQIPISWGP